MSSSHLPKEKHTVDPDAPWSDRGWWTETVRMVDRGYRISMRRHGINPDRTFNGFRNVTTAEVRVAMAEKESAK